ncbi:MAG: hypothetical protein JWO82_1145, partial [Akkermansiaceae bacterium]|nr:hypothetical protein [Akkermansiaceae bacterium]
MKQDPDAAFDAIVALNRENGAMPGEYLYLPESPTPERAVWLAGKLNDLTPNECSNLIQSQGLGMLGSSPEAALAFTRALTDPANRRQMADYAARSMPSIGVEAALPQLEFLGDPPARLAYLENFTSSFQRAIDSPGITPAGDQLLRTALQQWQATPQQIETIMTRVHAPPP